MKDFINKFFLLFFFVLSTTPLWLKIGIITPVGNEVDESIEEIENLTPGSVDTIKIGDSVGRNLNPKQQDKNGVLNLCTNQAISPLGHILFLKKSLQSQNKSKIAIIGYFRPSSLVYSNLDQEWTNNYFIKKFCNDNWLFNENLVSKNLSGDIDLKFLSRYKPWSALYRNSFINQYSPFMINSFGNNSAEQQHLCLIEYLLNTEFQSYFSLVDFQALPVHSEHFENEKAAARKLRSYGVNMKDPILMADSFFVEDKIHINKKYISNVKHILSATQRQTN